MDAIKFLREWDRMCDSMGDTCEGCELNDRDVAECRYHVRKHPEQSVKAVKSWMEKNPAKTRQSEFLKIFPDAAMDDNGIVRISPCAIEEGMRKNYYCIDTTCTKCRKDYWLVEVDE